MTFKVVFDSDGLIKLAKAEVLERLAKTWTCMIPQAVYEETVERGKRAAYPDAIRIEEILRACRVLCKRPSIHPHAKQILQSVHSLGRGEKEALHLFFQENANAIISDDARFLAVLERANVAYLPPALVLLQLVRRGEMSKAAAFAHLEKLQAFIAPEVYRRAREDLQKIHFQEEKQER